MLDAGQSATTAVSVVLLALLLTVLVILAVVVWSIKRHRDPHLIIECDQPLAELMPSLSGLTHAAVIEGNSVEILENGVFFDVMLSEMSAAKRSLHFETFLWKEGTLGQRVADVLADRARAGVTVRVLLDANGAKKMGRSAERQLIDAGCRVKKYHDKRLRNAGVMNQRDHRKLVVVDGHIAFAGGHCIVDSWLGDAQDAQHFRDISVRLRGPVVHAVQSTFSENWVDETGELFVGDDVFPTLQPAGAVAAHVARIKPQGAAPAVKILHHMAICLARKQILIQNPYFLPEPEAIEAFGQAVARGVDVRVMVPSADASDMPIVQHAAHRNFAKLLEAGVRIFEYPKTLLHQKVMVVDGVWCAIGSSNFDDRSFEINDEITLGFKDVTLAKQLEAIFARDAAECVELELQQWRQRGVWHRLKDRALYLFNEQL
jgi:cardiolipin synthase